MKPISPFRLLTYSALLCGFAATAAPAQSIYGPGGLLLNPTALVPPADHLTPAVLVLPQQLSGGGHQAWTSYDLDYGATRNLEVGATYLTRQTGGGSGGSAGGYFKYQLLHEARSGFALAVGANYLGGGNSDAQTDFVALEKSLTPSASAHPVHLHLGATYFEKLDGVTHRRAEPFAGLDFRLVRKVTLFGEARAALPAVNGNTDGSFPARAFGLIWQPGRDYKVVLGFANNGWNQGTPHFGIGVGYSIGGRQ